MSTVVVARKGGTIVTCASTSGFMHEYDNRYLWMSLKRIIGSHFANYREAYEANRLIDFINRKANEDAAKTAGRKAVDVLPEVMAPNEYQDTDEPF